MRRLLNAAKKQAGSTIKDIIVGYVINLLLIITVVGAVFFGISYAYDAYVTKNIAIVKHGVSTKFEEANDATQEIYNKTLGWMTVKVHSLNDNNISEKKDQ